MRILLGWLFVFFMAWSNSTLAKDKVDIVLLLDTSASMKTTDPNHYRFAAIRMFLSLLNEEDRIAVLSFDVVSQHLSDFVSLNPMEKEQLIKQIEEKGQVYGPYTNLQDPLARALDEMKARRLDAQPLVILLTDGKMDVGNADLDKHLLGDMRDKLVPQYRQEGIRLFSLAFGESFDLRVLQGLSDQTDGKAWAANQSTGLKNIFRQLFEVVKQPETLPVSDGRFRVGEHNHELTVLDDGRTNQPISLKSPSGKEYTEQKDGLIRVINPETGAWSLKGDQGGATIYGGPGLNLETRLPETMVETDQPLRLEAWLEKEGSIVRDIGGAIHIGLSLHALEEAASTPINQALTDQGDGRFSTSLPILKPGSYAVEIHADNGVLKKDKRLHLLVRPKPPVTEAPTEKLSFDNPEVRQAVKAFIWVNLALLVGGGIYFIWRRLRKTADSQRKVI